MNKLQSLSSRHLHTNTDTLKKSFTSAGKLQTERLLTSANERDQLLDQIRKQQDLIKLQQKEIERLTHINEYLMKSNQNKLSLLREERQINSSRITKMPIKGNIVMGDKKSYLVKLLDDQQPTQSPVVKRKTYRNATLARLHLESETELLKQEKRDSIQKTTTNFYDLLQMEDCFRINTILNLGLSDDDAIQQYNTDGTVALMRELLESEDQFSEIIGSISTQKLFFLFDKFKRIMSDHNQLFVLVLRLKKIIQGAVQMNASVLLDDALENIIDRCVDCLECDRASCFIVEQSKKELWTRVAKGAATTIRLQVGQGIAGYVASSKQILNIEDAYRDQRFNPNTDVKNNYKTKTLLVSPILDNDKCIGVLQCVNKNSGYFNKDDEALLSIMCEFSKSVLKNAMNRDAQMLIQNKLRHLIKTGIMLESKLDQLKEFLLMAEERLRSMMNVDMAKVAYFHDNILYHVDKDMEIVESDSKLGIMGACIESQLQLSVGNCYISPLFNPNIDVETNMPIICMPLKVSNHTITGAIQVVNVKGIGSISLGVDSKINTIDQEMLDLFCQQCAQCLMQFKKQN